MYKILSLKSFPETISFIFIILLFFLTKLDIINFDIIYQKIKNGGDI